jgi:signal transduction histidine kinase
LLSNLVANALTHGAKDGTVEVGGSIEGEEIVLLVANSGDPIPPSALARLFEPFSREGVHASQQGLGLGLYIASEIARMHGGALAVESSAERTRFTFRMPVRAPAA